MRNRWIQAGLVGAILAAITVVIVGIASSRGTESGSRAYELEQQLRCPVCQSVSIAESMSETAEGMRRKVDQLIEAGRTDRQILGYFRSRYGEWVVLDPPVGGNTLLVWVLPVLVGAGGTVAVLLRPRHRRARTGQLTPEAQAKVASEVERMRTTTGEEEPL